MHGASALVKSPDMSAFVLAHISDPHLSPLPRPTLRELMGKRALGYFNWWRNRAAHHSRELADALIADLKAQHPDHIALTGDLVNIALESEFPPATAWLHALGTPEDVTLVPGNHDAYMRATFHRHTTDWAEYMSGDNAQSDAAVTFPFLRRRGPLALIGTSTAVPTGPLLATGRLGAEQRARLAAMLDAIEPDAFRVLLIHHPLRSLKGLHKRMTDGPALIELLRQHRVDLVLHGHDHRHSLAWFDGPHGKVPALGVPSASAVADGRDDAAAYNLLAIAHEGNAWRCDLRVRGVGADGRTISELRRERVL